MTLSLLPVARAAGFVVPVLAACLVAGTSALAQGDWVVIETDTLVADDAATLDALGTSVALSGTTAIVGAPSETSVASMNGAAYVYTLGGATWSQQAKLKAADASANDRFGASVALQGTRAVVGAPQYDDGNGAAYVFDRTGTTWSQVRKLEAADGAFSDGFGFAVALDGNTIAVSAPFDDDGGDDAGAVYVFTGSGTSWTLQDKLVANDADADDLFGVSIALEGDRLAAGALGGALLSPGIGAAYVFQRGLFGWGQDARLGAAAPGIGDAFGVSVALSGDRLLVGANRRGASDFGAAYIFDKGLFGWSETDVLVPDVTIAQAYFGTSVALEDDLALIGSPHDAFAFGFAYVFADDGGGFAQRAFVAASNASLGDAFGYAVALEGPTALVGSLFANGPVLSDTGAAYVYDLRGAGGADACADAQPIEGAGKFPFDNRTATTDGPTATGCDFLGDLVHKDVWWCWTSPCTGKVTVQTCFQTELDDALAVYDGCTCPPTALLGCEESGCGASGNQSGVTFDAVAGNVYLIRLGSYSPSDGGYGQIEIVLDAACTDCPLGLASRYAGSGDGPDRNPVTARRLRALYGMRDHLLEDPGAGPRWIDLYARHAPRIAGIAMRSPRLLRRLAALVAVATPGLEALSADDPAADTLRVPPHAAALLEAVLDELEDADGDGALARELRAERDALDLSRIAGRTYADVWERVAAATPR